MGGWVKEKVVASDKPTFHRYPKKGSPKNHLKMCAQPTALRQYLRGLASMSWKRGEAFGRCLWVESERSEEGVKEDVFLKGNPPADV